MRRRRLNRLSLAWLVCLLSLPAVPLVFAADKRPLNIDDFARLRDVGAPQLSLDGERIAYTVSTADLTQDKHVTDIWMTNWRDGSERQLTFTPDSETEPRWSPDGRWLAYLSERRDDKEHSQLWILSMAGGEAEKITSLPGSVEDYAISPDGQQLALVVSDPDDDKPLFGILEDDATTQLIQVNVASGAIRQLTSGQQQVSGLTVARGDRIALLHGDSQHPAEVAVFDRNQFRPVTRQNAGLLAELRLAPVERTEARSPDGTRITGFVVKPPGYVAGRKYPTILRIHGGPTSQFAFTFSFEWQLLAANGYVVVAANPRGSTGRGEAFSKAIFADWGNLDAQDVIAHVDLAIANGIADPARLGVGGWSYGGMLTNYVIAQDSRFKAATSGASISNILAGYGTDMYIREYEMELGPPWKDTATWEKLSFPFLHADRIRTPTLFLCGSLDFNVPLLNSEQMYQALRSQNIPTQLVIYPGQNHGLTKLSYNKDRLERYLAWYARFLTP